MWLVAIRTAFRNLMRRPGRSFMTWLTIFLGTASTVCSVGMSSGIYGDMIAIATRSYIGHFQIVDRAYQKKPQVKRAISEPGSVLNTVAAHPSVVALTSRAEVAGMLTTGRRTSGILVVGVEDEGTEGKVSRLPHSLKQGTWLEPWAAAPRQLPMILGTSVAKSLQVGLGDSVRFSSQDAHGDVFLKTFVVVGLLQTGIDGIDSSMAFIRLPHAQALLGLGDRVHRVVGTLASVDELERLAGLTLREDLRLMSWGEVLPDLKRSIETDYSGMRLLLGLIMLIVVLGVVNTISMSVFERTHELGLLLALGTTPGQIVWLVLCEGMWLSLSGVALGAMLGTLVNVWLGAHGIPMGDAPIEFAGAVVREVHARNNFEGNVLFPILIFVSGSLAGLLPAVRAARITPVRALQPS